MPELIWKGKEQVMNHHLEVPVRCLDRCSTYNAEESENRIIHGDNLEALKALLPEYEGRVQCIYIDPPYNTGNESWVYNDNVKDPRIVKWLGEVVGKEGEDFCRHDKWLCMMYPRLQLLKRLLASDGSIWISIDDIEVHHLRLILDEVFGKSNFVANVLWQKKYSVANDHKTIAPMHDHVLVYRKSPFWERNLLPRTKEKDRQYRYEDEKGVFRVSDYTCNKTADERPNLYYPITNPNTDEEAWPSKSRSWAYSQEVHQKHVEEGLVYWGKNGTSNKPSFKRYKHLLKNADGVVPHTWWNHEFAGHTDAAKKDIRNILEEKGEVNDFITPKPVSLIERILQIGSDKNSIILDSFAGSGTTAHAVLNLNKKDGGNRKFILIEMMDYAETITAERVRRVIDGYGEDTKAVPGTGGDFSYYTLGERIFDAEDNLNEAIGIAKIRDYVARTEQLPGAEQGEHPAWLGEKDRTGYYFHYQPEQATFLNLDFLATLTRKNEAYLIYADVCLLDSDFMHRHRIRFKKIPRDISRF
jgi:adenine specific DNA methylase Mod